MLGFSKFLFVFSSAKTILVLGVTLKQMIVYT